MLTRTFITLLNNNDNEVDQIEKYLECIPPIIVYENEVYELLHSYEPYRLTYKWVNALFITHD